VPAGNEADALLEIFDKLRGLPPSQKP